MIWIIGGTTEARLLEKELLGKKDFIITVATEEGEEFLLSENVRVGRMDEGEMENFISENKIDIIVDCSHPYAKIVTKFAKEAAEKAGVKYYRVKRPMAKYDDSFEVFKTLNELLARLKELSGNFLITLGSKNIKDLVKVRGVNRFIFRVLPTPESISLLHNEGVKIRDIIAVLGPFSLEQNLLTMKENDIDYLVTKEAGDAGGAEEKFAAAKKAGVKVLILEREEEEGYSIEEILKLI